MSRFLVCECCNQTYLEEDMSKNNKNMCCCCWCYTRPKDKRIAELEEENESYQKLINDICNKYKVCSLKELDEKLKKSHKFLKVLTDMVFEKDMVAQINWSGANQEICCRYLKDLGYVKIDEDGYYVKVYKTFGRNEDE